MGHYIALVHGEDGNFGISFPDFPGCITVSSDLDHCPRRAAEVLAFHAAGMIEESLDLPKPRSLAEVLHDSDWGPDAREAVSILVPLVIPSGRKVQMDVMLDASLIGLIDEAALNRGQSRSEFVADATEAKLKAG